MAEVKKENDANKISPKANAISISEKDESKSKAHVSEPLAPPPKPAAVNPPAQTPDYFSTAHNGNTSGLEFNPFEQSFGAPSQTETPGKTLLPPVSALESPAIPGVTGPSGYTWGNQGLRNGPLSPAMLEGPAGGGDYFGNISRGFPTPNESSLRTGLTPGGTGSMFPAPSPNSQALFNSLQSGGATPGTIDFHRTAMNAAARNKPFGVTSNPQDHNGNMDAQHDAADAANGLFMLAKGAQAGQFPSNGSVAQQQMQTRSQNPTRVNTNAIDQNAGESAEDEDTKPARGRKGAKGTPQAARRKNSENTPKSSNKRQKTMNVDPALDPEADMGADDDMGDDDDEMDEDEKNGMKNGRKMTDEEKRRNFLERNRVAALKCRQRKKQWLANLQAKVEMYSAENDSLNSQVATLHDEIRNLRNLLIQHKDCPVGHAQGIGQFLNAASQSQMQDPSGIGATFGGHPGHHGQPQMNPYGMALQQGAR